VGRVAGGDGNPLIEGLSPMDQPVGLGTTASHGQAFSPPLTLFSFLWAVATLFHVASYDQWTEARLTIPTAFWVLLQPKSTLAVVALALAHVCETFVSSPFIPNHQLFAALANTTLIAGASVLALRTRRLAVSRDALFNAFAPAVRIALLVLYVFAVFHKLNTDWFDPRVSCGSTLYGALHNRFPVLPQSALWATGAIYLSLGFEIAIPLLLAVERTRHAGVLVGATFHWFLALHPFHGFYNFSSMLLALFSLFIRPELVTHLLERLGERRMRMVSLTMTALLAACFFLSVSSVNQLLGGVDPFLRLWTFYGLAPVVALAVFADGDSNLRRESGWQVFALPQPVLAVLPIVVFLNGLSPYLGLKTETAWAMFSNLRTEGGVSNHLLVPASVQVFDYQRDLVQVTRSSNSFLRRSAREGQLVPYFEVLRRPNERIGFIRNGVEHPYKRVSDDPSFPGEVSFLQAKFLSFRPVDRRRQTCNH
jgi:hypothetical protein